MAEQHVGNKNQDNLNYNRIEGVNFEVFECVLFWTNLKPHEIPPPEKIFFLLLVPASISKFLLSQKTNDLHFIRKILKFHKIYTVSHAK